MRFTDLYPPQFGFDVELWHIALLNLEISIPPMKILAKYFHCNQYCQNLRRMAVWILCNFFIGSVEFNKNLALSNQYILYMSCSFHFGNFVFSYTGSPTLTKIIKMVSTKALYIGKLGLPADVIQFSWLFLFTIELRVQKLFFLE